jgi:hypothetical protein
MSARWAHGTPWLGTSQLSGLGASRDSGQQCRHCRGWSAELERHSAPWRRSFPCECRRFPRIATLRGNVGRNTHHTHVGSEGVGRRGRSLLQPAKRFVGTYTCITHACFRTFRHDAGDTSDTVQHAESCPEFHSLPPRICQSNRTERRVSRRITRPGLRFGEDQRAIGHPRPPDGSFGTECAVNVLLKRMLLVLQRQML